jgi:hypothetical protein
MPTWLLARPRLFSGLALACGAGLVTLAGLGLTLLGGVFVQAHYMAPDASLSPWFWTIAPALVIVPLWLLVSWTLRRGGWRGVFGAVLMLGASGLVSWGLGEAESALDSSNDMAGVGFAMLAGVLVALAVVVAVLAGLVGGLRLIRARQESPASHAHQAGSQ